MGTTGLGAILAKGGVGALAAQNQDQHTRELKDCGTCYYGGHELAEPQPSMYQTKLYISLGVGDGTVVKVFWKQVLDWRRLCKRITW